MKVLHLISFILLVIGGLNWGLVGFFDWNLVAAIFGTGAIARIIYALVGIAAIIKLTGMNKCKCGNTAERSAPAPAPEMPTDSNMGM